MDEKQIANMVMCLCKPFGGRQVLIYREAWNSFISDPLALGVFIDEDLIPPNLDVIQLACDMALYLRNGCIVPPTSVVPDGEGGISFEWVEGKGSQSLNIYVDQSIELLIFDDCCLRSRYHIAIEGT